MTMPSTWTEWALAYFLSGAAWLMLMRLWAALFVKEPSPLVAAAREAGGSSRKPRPWKDRLADASLMTAVAIAAGLLWPALMGLMVVSWISQRLRWPGGGFDWTKLGDGPSKEKPRYPFRCRKKDCIRKVTAEEAEQGAAIIDPLGKVPPVPFGHLNPAWLRLQQALNAQGDQAALWYFEAAPRDALTGKVEDRSQLLCGYAVLAGSTVLADFVFRSRSVKQ